MKVALLSGGVGGARLARGFEALTGVDTTVIVNVGDDERVYGLAVSPDLDTVIYTMAGVEGPQGWGRRSDSQAVMDELARFGVDTSFTVGDRDLALNLYRTSRLAGGGILSEVTREISDAFGLRSSILPSTDESLRTEVCLADSGEWIDFQTYFVKRRHADRITDVRFAGGGDVAPAPGVTAAIAGADLVVIGPSNPVLSVWPILAVTGIEAAIRAGGRVLAVSPLIGGRAVKGPAAEVLEALGFETGSEGVLAAYRGLVTDLVVDGADAGSVATPGVTEHVTDTMMPTREASERLAREIVSWL
ncbi:MAG TPA: 2-phospho-L-lactate transferase [Acidimicrobiia bacterium]